MNQDGKTKGIAMPNGEAQVALMKSVYEKSGLDPRDAGYIEAHGTGTKGMYCRLAFLVGQGGHET
jgi:acyl transferase domain-containing protein